MYYATLYQAKSEIKTQAEDGAPATAPDDAYVKAALTHVTARIDQIVGVTFAPRHETIYLDALGAHIDEYRQVLTLGFPLLAVTTLVDGQGNSLTEGTDFHFRPRGEAHTFNLRRVNGGDWTDYDDDWMDAIAITGPWGWRTHYATEGWFASNDTLQAGVDDAETTFSVADADEADAKGLTPRFSPGNLVRIDDEFAAVRTVIYGDTNTLTVERGVRGSEAADHDAGAAIEVWSVEPDVVRAAMKWVGLLYKRRGSFEKATFDGIATVQFPDDAPGEVTGILAPYCNAMKLRATRVL